MRTSNGAVVVLSCLALPWLAGRAYGQVTATWDLPNSGNWSDPTRWDTNPLFPNNGNGGQDYHAVINEVGAAYTVTLDQNITIEDFTLDSPDATFTYLLGSEVLTVRGNFIGRNNALIQGGGVGGNINVTGTLTFERARLNGMNIIAEGPIIYNPGGGEVCEIDDTDINHGDGSAVIMGPGDIVMSNGASIVNEASSTMTIMNSSQIRFSNIGATPSFSNAGTMIRDTDAGVAELLDITFENTGSLEVRTGTFRTNGLDINGNGNRLTGGVYRIDGGSLDLMGETILVNEATVELANAAGTFADFDSVTSNAALGSLLVGGGRAFTTAGNFQNDGMLDVEAASTFEVITGSQLQNIAAGTLTGGEFDIKGTLRAPTGGGITNIASIVTLDGVGADIVDSGTSLSAIDAADAVDATGEFAVLNGRDFTSTGDFQNDGVITVDATTTFEVTTNLTNIAGTTLTGGEFNVAGTFIAPNATGLLTLDGKVTLDGAGSSFEDGGGNDALAVVDTVGTNGELGVLNGRTFITDGDVTLNGVGKLTVGAGSQITVDGVITNFVGGTFTDGNLDVAGTLVFNGANIDTVAANLSLNDPNARIEDENGNDAFRNLDTITAAGTLGITNERDLSVTGPLTTAGALTVGSIGSATPSTLTVPGPLTQTAGITTLANGEIFAGGGFNLVGGVLRGTGFINGDVVSNGVIRPGLSPGLLTVTGDLTLRPEAIVEIELAGLLQGVPGGYDLLAISDALVFEGQPTLATMRVLLLGGFVPEFGDAFRVMTFGSRAGEFARYEGLELPNGLRLEVHYVDLGGGAGAIDLVAVPAPPAALIILGLVAAARRRR